VGAVGAVLGGDLTGPGLDVAARDVRCGHFRNHQTGDQGLVRASVD
jgi:hypothetical protein